jgi:hypothetical protein
LIDEIDAPVRRSTPQEAWNRIDDSAELAFHTRPLVMVAVTGGCTFDTAKSIILWCRLGLTDTIVQIGCPSSLLAASQSYSSELIETGLGTFENQRRGST